VLLVEDHLDIREALVAILEGEGYEVVAVESAEAGFEQLTHGRFHLVVTDYSLPVKTGGWMLEEARSQGALGTTKCLLITAHPEPKVPRGVEWMQKPVDVDDFLSGVARLLAEDRQEVMRRFSLELSGPPPKAVPTRPVELALYISSASPSSLRALRNVRVLLERYDPSQVALTVHDLSKQVGPEVDEDRIAFTPTLVRRHPTPKAWILGDLEQGQILVDVLSLAGVEQQS